MKLRQHRAGRRAGGERAQWLDRVDLASFCVRAPAVLILLDPDLKVMMASDGLAEVCGVTVKELLGKTPRELLPSIAAQAEGILRRVAETGEPRLNFEVIGELPISPGILRRWRASCFPATRMQDGRYAIGVISAETHHSSAWQLLPRVEWPLRDALNLAHVGTWESNLLTGGDTWSPQLYEIFGLDSSIVPSYELFRSMVHSDDREMLDVARATFLASYLPFDLPLRIIRPDRGGRVIRYCGTLAKTSENEPIGIVGVIQDVSSQYHAESALRESETRMKALVCSVDQVAFEFDAEGVVVNVWSGNDELLVLPQEDMIGKKAEEVLGDELFNRWWPMFKRVLQSGVAEDIEYSLRVRAGPRWFLAHLVPMPSADGIPKSLCLLARDVTERKRTEQTMHQLSIRLLGIQDEERRRTSQFLHETTAQSLLAVKLNLQAAVRNPAITAGIRDTVLDTLDLVEGTMQEIRTLSYVLHPPMLDEAGIASALRWYVKGFSERSGIAVTVDEVGEFERLPREIETMIFRVVTEALSNVHRHSGSPKAAIHLCRHAQEAVIEIEDWGRGISPERLRVAESGTLGVGIVGMRERVAQLGGGLAIKSESGKGTMIRLAIPVVAAKSSAAVA